MNWPRLHPWEVRLVSAYPNVKQFAELSSLRGSDDVLRRFANLHLLEGIPYAFADNPYHYEIIRDAIAFQLGISGHCICLVGSARFGFSYSQNKWPKQFEFGASDLDFFICSQHLFEKCQEEVEIFRSRVLHQKDKIPETDYKHYMESLEWIDKRRPLGFINHDKIPPREHYPTISTFHYLQNEIRNQYKNIVKFSKTKFRIYANWEFALNEITHNLKLNLKAISEASKQS